MLGMVPRGLRQDDWFVAAVILIVEIDTTRILFSNTNKKHKENTSGNWHPSNIMDHIRGPVGQLRLFFSSVGLLPNGNSLDQHIRGAISFLSGPVGFALGRVAGEA